MAPLAIYRASVLTAIYDLLPTLKGEAFGCNMVAPFATFKLLDLLAAFMGSRYAPSPIKKAYSWLLDLGRRRGREVRVGDYVALALFTRLPLTVTGAWTASLIAYVLGFKRWRAIIIERKPRLSRRGWLSISLKAL